MNDYEQISASFTRCDGTGKFSDTFYDIFMSKSDDIKLFFENTDFSKQKKLLRATVKVLATKDIKDVKTKKILGDIARTHSRSGYNIAPKYYDLWLNSLCETVARLDPEYSVNLEHIWRNLMRKAIDIIVDGYDT